MVMHQMCANVHLTISFLHIAAPACWVYDDLNRLERSHEKIILYRLPATAV